MTQTGAATTPPVQLPIRGEAWSRPNADQMAAMQEIGSATACAKLHQVGIRRSFVEGPVSLQPGQKVVGSALTLQFMPQREDLASGVAQEYVERNTALWAVMETVEPGDVLVIQAYGSKFSGCIGDILARYFQRKGGAGIVVDGRIRDAGRIRELGIPVWSTGTTPHYASQSELFPWAYDVPVAVGGALCLPGDFVVADDDGPVIVPQALAPEVCAATKDHQDWEVFSRTRLDQGARLSDYYPLTPETRAEYEAWLSAGSPR
ncbi:ribonuclease activity regulator RraA [Nocardioides marmorisolisilvae]|uniref:Putative 4-hydroxy-4-methyl-2-oxoglutarate aldolase n=1 Tax=Nocardioides marmorisolisilvae TaxID=1542737 RepID=A0A3N0DPQ2_9ACTN|nr:ribonuclease activity regulator RraA [Nocardioides marmorisolisilvae]RNL77629.1 ribonuclease activity regulator RraA [Nocardioides marmorisolisilvae]